MERGLGRLLSLFPTVLIIAVQAFAAACGQSGAAPADDASTTNDATLTPQATQTVAAIETPAPQDTGSGQEYEPEAAAATEAAPEPADQLAGRIAYVTPDLNIRTVEPDGTGDRLLTRGPGRYSWPTWAPDGVTVAFPAVVGEGVAAHVSLLAAVDGIEGETVLYRGDPQYAGILVAPNLPHYPVWSPDGEKLALITGGEAGLEVYVDDLQDEAGPVHVASQAPVYFSWSHTSRYLLVHRGGRHVLVDTEPEIETTDLQPFAAGYRAPAWWPSNDLMTLIERDDQTGIYGVHFRDLYGEARLIIGASPRDGVPVVAGRANGWRWAAASTPVCRPTTR